MDPFKKPFPFFLLILFCAFTRSVDLQAQQTRTPNIIIVYCDDLGYGDLGLNGHPEIRTPNLDHMAMQGMRFSNYYSASPACTASRYALLTGRYPIRSGFGWVLNPKSKKGLHPREITLAEILKKEGYHTAIFGKWHLGSTDPKYLPLQNGFDRYLGLPYSNDMIPPKHPDIPLLQDNDTLELNPDQRTLTRRYSEAAMGFIRENKKQPFFLYLPFAMPHVPLHPGQNFEGRSKRGAYGDVVEEIDYYVGKILNTLQEQGLAENTIVWFMSDNGPWILKGAQGGSAGLFRDGKGSTWEGGMRVPCIVWAPGRIPAGAVNDDLVNAMDVFTSVAHLTGGAIPTDRPIDGRGIPVLLNRGAEPIANRVFYYYGIKNQLMAVRQGDWKLHVKTYSQLGIDYFPGAQYLLFNLREDPSEQYNLAQAHPDRVKAMTRLIDLQNKQIAQDGNFWD